MSTIWTAQTTDRPLDLRKESMHMSMVLKKSEREMLTECLLSDSFAREQYCATPEQAYQAKVH